MKHIGLYVLLLLLLTGCTAVPHGITEMPPSAAADLAAPTAPHLENVPPEVLIVPVTEITLRFQSLSFRPGETVPATASVFPSDATDTTLLWTTSDPAVATVDEAGLITAVGVGQCTVTAASVQNPAVTATVAVTVGDADTCVRIDGILIANKSYSLPETYAPRMDREAFSHLCDMFAAAKAAGYTLWVKSDYRSYYDQRYIYNGYAARDGKEAADRYSARAGHSEHQSGLAFDLNELTFAFGESAEGIWLAENCHKYGFILRYPKDKEEITGYMYEPWHVRYIGTEEAALLHESGMCLEEYFGIPSVYGDE